MRSRKRITSQKQKSLRSQRILKMMGKGMYITDIVTQLAEEWQCSESRVYQYIQIVKKQLQKEYEESSGGVLSQFIHLYQIALDKNDYKTANLIAQNIAKFTKGEKLTQIQEVNINFGNDTNQ